MGFAVYTNIAIWLKETYVEAARREKRFKNWCRQWKINLIEELNADWLQTISIILYLAFSHILVSPLLRSHLLLQFHSVYN
jgi:hypothetical protein